MIELKHSQVCVVCLEEYRPLQELRVLPCGHEFHKGCVDPWLLHHYTCPLCNYNIVGGCTFLTNFCPPLRFRNQFLPSVPTFAVRETDVFRHNGGTSGAPFRPLRDDSALRALSSLRGLRGAPEAPPLCRETSVSRTANVGTVGMNGLNALLLWLAEWPMFVSFEN